MLQILNASMSAVLSDPSCKCRCQNQPGKFSPGKFLDRCPGEEAICRGYGRNRCMVTQRPSAFVTGRSQKICSIWNGAWQEIEQPKHILKFT